MIQTVSDLIGSTRRYLMGMSRGSMNRLAVDIDATTTTLAAEFELEQSMLKGSYICIDDEIMYVYSADTSSKTLTVERGQLGTDNVTHTNHAQIEGSPRFPKPVIREALQQEIASWPTSLYKVAAIALNVPTSNLSVDLAGIPSTFIDILEVVQRPTVTSSQQQLSSFSTSWPQVGFRVERNMPTVDYPSGAAMFLNKAMFGGYTLQVTYSVPFTVSAFGDTNTLVGDMGLEQSMVDIPPLGAAATLLSSREAMRSQLEGQGEARASVEVPMGSTISSALRLRQLRDTRIVEESARLASRYRWRRTA